MANIQERRNKDGKLISYSIRVHRGRDANGSSSNRGQLLLRCLLHGRKKAHEKKPRLSPRPLKKSVNGYKRIAVKNSLHIVIM